MQFLQIECAVIIQAMVRRRSSVIRANIFRYKFLRLQVLKTTKAVLIRRWWKGHLCIIRAKEKRREKLNNIQLLLEIHLWAYLIGKDPPLSFD